ncbi:MAG: prepilin peptidase leader peptidase (prepilin peptidase) / N-methyltransferase [Candidatus Nomurabacteria bacterium]|nr:prepilin peptidase leader peptidase (prepilin peptidase) / N-methyltransferase [Candidatus Nomurabacteria bacterium]
MRYQYDGGGYEVFLGPIVIALPFLIIWIVSRGKALGFGDVILFLGVGAFFGIEQGLAVLLLSIWLGALVGICIYILRKQMGNKNTAIPFVPYIVISFLFVLFTQIDVYSIARVVS